MPGFDQSAYEQAMQERYEKQQAALNAQPDAEEQEEDGE